jgi:transposase InsO family protein
VRHLVLAKRYPQRRVCRLVGLSRSSARYEPRGDKDEEKQLVERLKKFARNPRKRRRGYRLAHKDIEREWKKRGKALNHKRVHRLWRREGLSIAPRRHRKRLRSGKPATERVATAPDSIWCFDFVEVKTVRGQKLRIFCVSDEFTRESLAIEVGTSFRSDRVCATLEKLMRTRGIPGAFRMDNGPEFIALALRGLCHRTGIEAGYIDPGKPWQNGFAESFHSRLRDEYLDGEVFWGVRDAQVGLDGYRRYFNDERLHSSLGYRTPLEFAAQNAALKASDKLGDFPAGSPVAKAA